MQSILARVSIGISELKVDPGDIIERADGPVAVLDGDKVVAYLVPAAGWEAVCESLEDHEAAETVRARSLEKAVSVSLKDL